MAVPFDKKYVERNRLVKCFDKNIVKTLVRIPGGKARDNRALHKLLKLNNNGAPDCQRDSRARG